MRNGDHRTGGTNGNAAIAIEVEHLTKSFAGKVVVRDLSMRVRRGQIYGFLGPNGSGKTTTLRMLCGILTPHNLSALSDELLGRTGIDMVAPFGASLHVAGRDAEALETAIAPFKSDEQFQWVASAPSLEDVFIDLMARSQDNFQ